MKIAILGSAPSWERAPWGDPSWEIWGLNDMYCLPLLGPCTRWFELHGDTPLTRARRPPDHFERIKAMTIPVYYLHGEPWCPSATKLDVEACVRQGRDYFTCTYAYEIAFALSLGAREIAVYGAPLQGNREVLVERPCVAWWLGLAEGRGVKITVDHDMPVGLLEHPYRYAEQDRAERQLTYDYANMLFWSLARWLPEENQRLMTMEEP